MSVTELVSGEHRAAAKAAARAANHVAPDTTAGSHWWGRLAPLAVPAADAVALAAAVTIAGAGWPMAGYAAAVFTVLAVGGQQRLRICLRTSDQVGRIVGAAALPLLIALPWMPPGGALRAALSCAALVVAVRAVGFAVLRALHRRGRLMEHALVVGVGPLGAQVARLLGEHRELGLRPRGFVDSADSADSADAGSRPPGGGAPPATRISCRSCGPAGCCALRFAWCPGSTRLAWPCRRAAWTRSGVSRSFRCAGTVAHGCACAPNALSTWSRVRCCSRSSRR